MISRLVKKIGNYSITVDSGGIYTVLDPFAREVASGPDLEAMENAATMLGNLLVHSNHATWRLN